MKTFLAQPQEFLLISSLLSVATAIIIIEYYYNNNNDNNKGPFLKYLALSPLKVIYRHSNTTQTFGFGGIFSEIMFSPFIFYFELKSN